MNIEFIIEYRIWVSFNKITKLNTDLFSGLENLKELNLYGNKLKTLDCDLLMGLKKLKSIDLAFNQIADLKEDSYEYILELIKYLN
jgi:Leucine-rich repeat (LRR) protein